MFSRTSLFVEKVSILSYDVTFSYFSHSFIVRREGRNHDRKAVCTGVQEFTSVTINGNEITLSSSGRILPAATLSMNNFYNILANSMKLHEFFRNLTENNLMWSVGVHCHVTLVTNF